MSNQEILLSIIIPCYNNANFTKNCILDLLRLPDNHEIIVIDNGSTDNTRQIVETLANTKVPGYKSGASLRYVRLERNLGFGRANNRGYSLARGKYVLFLNNDIRVEKNHDSWTKPLIEAVESGGLAAAQGGLLNKNFHFVKEVSKYIDDPFFYLSGWCLIGSKETFEWLREDRRFVSDESDLTDFGKCEGPWSVHYRNYFEDDHLSFMAKKMNINLKIVPVPVYHFGRMTGKQLNLPKMYQESHAIFTNIWKDKI